FYLSALSKTEEALWHIQQAKHLDPMSLMLQAAECAVLVWGRQAESAIAKAKKIVELEPGFFPGQLYLSWAFLMLGMADEAIQTAEEAARLSDDTPPAIAALGNAYSLAGQIDRARLLAESLLQRSYPPSVYISSIYASIGDIDEAFRWLARAERDRSPALFSLRIGLWSDRFRSDPRFDALVHRV